MLYVYEASDSEGSVKTGDFEAPNPDIVVGYLQKQGLVPISIRPKQAATKSELLQVAVFESFNQMDKIVLVRNLSASLKAGLSILESLEILIADAEKSIVKKILIQAKSDVENGYPISKTFERYKRYFPPFFIGMVKAGEASGKLDNALDELFRYLNREHGLIQKVRSAMAYPVILLTAATGIIFLLVGYVLPKLQNIFRQSSFVLPLSTRILLKISGVVSYSFILDFAVFLAVIALIIFLSRSQDGRRISSKIMFKTPLVRDLLKKVALVRFTRTMASSVASGMSILESLNLSAESVGNEHYRAAIAEVAKSVIGGQNFSEGLKRFPKLFPHFLVNLTGVGERTGTLENVLQTFADFYDEQVDESLKALTTFLEPALLLLMGLIIGGIALSILLPIYQFVGKFV